ncbi:hypothetical protein FFONT_1142 [Fervidicoccus fontis Kam940]|jgi:predicted RNA binding protein with dsRBD fold (UPF0201 family)|uniref:UPF0201 protein FFONT_1142 n=2 Tax=Fervidicoccus fontis TaxID=683846 RepID=I0A2C3_FERFK|nr:hypothetical protein FFONT_1142 [Fervidicoccus fontis Kam940]
MEIPVKPTESEKNLALLVEKIMEPEEIYSEDLGIEKKIVARSKCISSLKKMHYLLRSERILDSARRYLKEGVADKMIVVMLHKQALAAGRISFVSEERESPLGAVKLYIYHDNPHDVIDWLAPPTRKGRPVFERGVPEPDCY